MLLGLLRGATNLLGVGVVGSYCGFNYLVWDTLNQKYAKNNITFKPSPLFRYHQQLSNHVHMNNLEVDKTKNYYDIPNIGVIGVDCYIDDSRYGYQFNFDNSLKNIITNPLVDLTITGKNN